LKFFLFEWRFADWPWNVVILLGFQVPVPYFDLIFGICDTCRCETTLNFFPMIPESYENEYSILLILTAFEDFLV